MRAFLGLMSLFLLGSVFSVRADTVPPGTQISVQMDRPISISEWDRGRIYRGRIARDVIARDGDVAIPAGAPVEMIVRQTGPNRMALDVESVTVRGRRYVMDTSGPQFHTNEYENGGGLVGNILGAIAGVEAEGNRISVPADAILTFDLRAPLHVVDWEDPGYERNGEHYHYDRDWYR